MRRDAVYPATIVGRPPMEDCYLGKATERLFLPLLRLTLPEIVDLELPIEGVFHNCAVDLDPQGVSRARAQGDERRLGHGADDVHQVRRGRRRARRRARPERGRLARVQQRRPAPRHDGRRRAARRARPLEPAGALRRQDGHRRHARPGPTRATAASGRPTSPWTRPSSRGSRRAGPSWACRSRPSRADRAAGSDDGRRRASVAGGRRSTVRPGFSTLAAAAC